VEVFISQSAAIPSSLDELYVFVESLEESMDSTQDAIDSIDEYYEDMEHTHKATKLQAKLVEQKKSYDKASKRILELENAETEY
jgi:phage shock protein A